MKITVTAQIFDGNMGDGWNDQHATACALREYTERERWQISCCARRMRQRQREVVSMSRHKMIDINFTMPEGAFSIKKSGDMFYVSDVNGDEFDHERWANLIDGMSPHMIGRIESYHPSVLFKTMGEALIQAELARIEFAMSRVREMRSNRAISREQYLDAVARIEGRRDIWCAADEAEAEGG